MRFVLVDKITMAEPGRRAEGYRDLSPDAEHYRDHMPGFPIEPGVLVLESMAQLGGRLIAQSVKRASGVDVLPMLTMVAHAEFRRPVRPPCRLVVTADVVSIKSSSARVTTEASVDGGRVASATLTYVLMGLDNDAMGIGADRLSAVRDWGDRTWKEMDGTARGR